MTSCQVWNRKCILWNNLESKHSLPMKSLLKNSTKKLVWKIVPGCSVNKELSTTSIGK